MMTPEESLDTAHRDRRRAIKVLLGALAVDAIDGILGIAVPSVAELAVGGVGLAVTYGAGFSIVFSTIDIRSMRNNIEAGQPAPPVEAPV